MLKKIAVTVAMLAVALPAAAQVSGSIETPEGSVQYNVGTTGLPTSVRVKYDDGGVVVPGTPVRPVQETVKQRPIREVQKEVKEIREGVRVDIKDVRQEGIKEIKTEKAQLEKELRNNRQEFGDDRKENRQELKVNVKAVRTDNSKDQEEKSAEIKVLRAQFEADRKIAQDKFKAEQEVARKAFELKRKALEEQLKVKLGVVKDAKKKEIAMRVGSQLNDLNVKMVKQMGENVNQIETVLGKISVRADELALAGTDVTAVRAAVETAKTALVTARAAITVQTNKTYPVAVTTEANLKNDFGQVRQQLETDLKVVRATIDATREAVRAASKTLPL